MNLKKMRGSLLNLDNDNITGISARREAGEQDRFKNTGTDCKGKGGIPVRVKVQRRTRCGLGTVQGAGRGGA
jgi:hypothetical protein